MLSVWPRSMTNASPLIPPSPAEQHTDSPGDFPTSTRQQKERCSGNRTACFAMSRGCSQGQTHKVWDYTQLRVPKGSREATGSFKRFTSCLSPHRLLPISSIIILAHSLALIRLLGGTWMQGMLQHCQGHYEAGPRPWAPSLLSTPAPSLQGWHSRGETTKSTSSWAGLP